MKLARLVIAASVPTVLVLAAGRCATAPPVGPRDQFPLDPREEITGPFEERVVRGWRALASGEAALAAREFAFGRAESGPSGRAAAIGMIEALVLTDRSTEALDRCAEALAQSDPTVPLLVACGEARASAGEPLGAYELYQRAVARVPNRSPLLRRQAELRRAGTDWLLSAVDRALSAGERDEARAYVDRALSWDPQSAAVLARAAEVECVSGEKERALQYYREALNLGNLDDDAQERAGALALETGDYSMAVSVFDGLAARDARFRESAAEARLAFRIANWPEAERQAAHARRLTRAGAASLVWWMFPEVREARVREGVVASDVLQRRDSRAMMRAISLGLLDVDLETHRARPDAVLSRGAAAHMILRLAGALRGSSAPPACLEGSPGPWKGNADALRLAARCGLLSQSGGPVVGGSEFTRGLDRLRSLLPSGEATNRD